MSVNILLMTYNGAGFIREVINSFNKVGKIYVYVDSKTVDDTFEIAQKMGVSVTYFRFVDFAESRNKILSAHKGYNIFIDDSFLFKGSPLKFRKEVIDSGANVVAVNILRGERVYKYSKITKNTGPGSPKYIGKVHEYIDRPATYLVKSGYFIDTIHKDHVERTINRLPKDLEILSQDLNSRNVYYIAMSYLLLHKYKLVSDNALRYWLIQRISMEGKESEKINCQSILKALFK